MQNCCKISEKLDTLIDIVKDGFAPASPVRGYNYSTSRDGRRYFVPRDRGRRNSLSDTKNKKEQSMCHIHKKNSETEQFYKFGKLLSRQHSATAYAGGVTKSHLLCIHDCSTGLKF